MVGCDVDKQSIELYKEECYTIIKDMFGVNTEKYKKAKERIDKSQTIQQISNVMSWVRVDLL